MTFHLLLCVVLRYRKGDDKSYYHYVDVSPGDLDKFEITDLKDDTSYSFAIMAFNTVGESEYTADMIEVKTKGKNNVVQQKKQISPL